MQPANRIDAGVTTQARRLTALPFMPHKRTQRLRVPIGATPAALDAFEPAAVPTAAQALAEPARLAAPLALFVGAFLEPLLLAAAVY